MQDSTKAWWKDTLERLVWTFIQGALGVTTGVELVELFTNEEMALGTLFAMLAGGLGSVYSLIKSVAAERLSSGGTSQWGVKTYSYTEAGPGSAGGDLETE